MKTLTVLASALVTAAALSQSVSAAPSNNAVYFQAPAIAGSGCPAGTTDFAITPDGQTLTILFDAFSADPGNVTCNVAVPVHVPNGFQVSLMTADFRGFVEGSAELRRSYFFAGATGPALVTPLSSSSGKEYTQRDNLMTMSESFAKCGQDVNLRINSRIRTKNSKSSISVDSLDLNNGMVFQLQYKKCN
ncbi:DUF4360 domain-containing protein [uncultured Thiothrix sp.]|uniref:DUF4360 domain-containing protein n=1 Tax=uncultured Thiothrix sp. TaxID=223185 RepID=UPI002618DAA8|nr:DUF4360 domain-containing protein [uncultured Thiothrix sp.]